MSKKKRINEQGFERMLEAFREAQAEEVAHSEELTQRILARVNAFRSFAAEPAQAQLRISEAFRHSLEESEYVETLLDQEALQARIHAEGKPLRPWAQLSSSFAQWEKEPSVLDHFFDSCLSFSRFSMVGAMALVLFTVNLKVIPDDFLESQLAAEYGALL